MSWHRTQVLLWILLPIFFYFNFKSYKNKCINICICDGWMKQQKCVFMFEWKLTTHFHTLIDNPFAFVCSRIVVFDFSQPISIQPTCMHRHLNFNFHFLSRSHRYLIDLWKLLLNIMNRIPVGLPVSKVTHRFGRFRYRNAKMQSIY